MVRSKTKFKKDGHEFVNFRGLEKDEINRVVLNCKPERQYGLFLIMNGYLIKKQLALGNEITQQDGEPRIASNIDKIKQYTYKIIAFTDEESIKGATGTGVAIAKNYIATNCHVVVDPELSKRNNRTGENADYYEVILVKNLFDESKMGQVRHIKKVTKKILIFVF